MEGKDIKSFRAGMYWMQAGYRSFTPEEVNGQWTATDPRLHAQLEEAAMAVGELNGLSKLAPDIDFFVKMHALKEATHSSRIEGIATDMKEALYEARDVRPKRRDDWQEVNNYVRAMNYALQRLETLPLSNRLLRETHAELLKGARGDNKQPGEFRRVQNWIGGKTLDKAVFVPPRENEVPDLMGDLELFLQNDELDIPDLFRVGIAHYQFETIHPFLDGNGRLGRLIITLYLVSRNLLDRPSLYLSDYLEANKREYVIRLMEVRLKNDMAGWLSFFLKGVRETAQKGVRTLEAAIDFRRKAEGERLDGFDRKRGNALKLLSALYKRPVISVKEAADLLGVQDAAAMALLRDMEKAGLLGTQRGDRNRLLFSLDGYLALFDPQRA